MRKTVAPLALFTVLILACAAQTQRLLFIPGPGSPVVVGNHPTDIAAADINRDGNLDIVTANYGSHDVTILLSDGRGGFRSAPSPPVPIGYAPHLVALGDVNHDGKLDMALTSHDSNDVIVLLGDGRSWFAPATGSPVAALTGTQPHNHGLALADVNADTHPDILTSNQNHHSVSVLLGDGHGGFRPAAGSPFPVDRAPYPLAVGDVNNDGKPDIVTPNVGSNNLTVLLGDGRGGFSPAPASPLAVQIRPYFVALADFNGDHNLDIAASHDDITLISVLLGDGHGGFRPAPGSPFDIGERGGEICVGDMNADSRLDLVTGTNGNDVRVLLGDGRGAFRPAPGSPFAVGRGPWGVALADINRDGKLDILTANFDTNDVTVLLAQ